MNASDRQVELAHQFRRMHREGPVLQICNAWDASSARMLAAAGAPAIGTTSFGVALAHGYTDGEQLPWADVLATAKDIVDAVDVPVTVDIEAGHGEDAAAVGRSVADVIATGAVGVNIEDSVPGQAGQLFDVSVQCDRYAAAVEAAGRAGVPLFVNARCDVFFGASIPADQQTDETLRRAKVYADAGVDGLFLPGLLDPDTLRTITSEVSLPVNVMVGHGSPDVGTLAAAGVRRTSQGGEPFMAVLGTMKQMTDEYLAGRPGAPMTALASGMPLLPALVSRS